MNTQQVLSNGKAQVLLSFDVSYNKALCVKLLGHKPTDLETGKAQKYFTKNVGIKIFTSISEFAKFLSEGHTFYTGTFKEGSTSAKIPNVSHSNVIFYDFDSSVQMEEILKHPFVQKYGGIIQPSYNADLTKILKFHLLFFTNRSINTEEYKILWKIGAKALGYELDPSKKGANNLCYGSPHKPIIINMVSRLPVDTLLAQEAKEQEEQEKQQAQQTSGVPKTTEVLTNQVLKHLYAHVFEEKLDRDINKLYCLHSHNLIPTELTALDRAEGIKEKYEGSNPFSPTDASKRSFVVSVKENQLPGFFDRSNNFVSLNSEGKERHGDNFLRYWHEMHLKAKVSPYPADFKQVFKQVVKDICNHFDVETFDFRKKIDLDVVTEFLRGQLDRKVFKPQWENNVVFMYDEKCNTWNYRQKNDNIYSDVLSPIIHQQFGREVAENFKVQKHVMTWFNVVHWDCLVSPKIENLDYIPFIKGYYDLKNYRYVDTPSEHVFNLSRVEYSYQEVSDNDPVLLAFKQHFKDWLKEDILAEFLLLWTQLCCQRQAYRTGSMVGLIGDPNTGKSTYCMFLLELFGSQGLSSMAKSLDADTLMSKSNNHATASLENAYVVVLEEMVGNSNYTDINKLKAFTGQRKGIPSSVNPKGFKERPVLHRLGLVWNKQDMVNVPGTDAGFFRRNLILEFKTKKHFNPKTGKTFDFLRQAENLLKIYCWCIQQSIEKALNRVEELKDHKIFQEFKVRVRMENCYIAQWLDEMVNITNLETDFVSSSDLQQSYEQWAEQNKATSYGKKKFFVEFKTIASDKTLGFDWDEKDSVTKTINGVKQRGYTGVKFKVESETSGF
ncbi:MAG: hypothetical protein KME30_17160 [Iphinoe sp. HA4291-MV1]|jgi:phage/plasmid-associated DNA primase|nr:hypothetical protein [Iphinoe sp. HA4291-MV1]